MKKKKVKANPIVNIIATMKLAKALDCSYEEAAEKLKAATIEVKNKPVVGKSKYFNIPVIKAGNKSAREMIKEDMW